MTEKEKITDKKIKKYRKNLKKGFSNSEKCGIMTGLKESYVRSREFFYIQKCLYY